MPKLMKGITRLGSIVSRLVGKGKFGDSEEVMMLLERKEEDDFGEEVKSVINKMSFGRDLEGVEILGSMGFKAQRYTTDYDSFEVVKSKSLSDIKSRFQRIIRDCMRDERIVIGDIKLGSKDEYKILEETARVLPSGRLANYNASRSLAKAKKMMDMKIISEEEYELARSLLKKKPSVEELKDIVKQLRFNIIRWSPREVLAGFKEIRGGIKYTLEEAFQSKSLFKLDTIGYLQDKYTEFSIIYDLRLNGKRLNYTPIDTLKTLEGDLLLYKTKGNWFKYLKRLFSWYNYNLKYNKLLSEKKKEDYYDEVVKIVKILNSDVGILYTAVQDLEVILFLLDDMKVRFNDKMEGMLDELVDELGNVYSVSSYLQVQDKVHDIINEAKQGKRVMIQRLVDLFSEIISKHTDKLIKKEKLKVL